MLPSRLDAPLPGPGVNRWTDPAFQEAFWEKWAPKAQEARVEADDADELQKWLEGLPECERPETWASDLEEAKLRKRRAKMRAAHSEHVLNAGQAAKAVRKPFLPKKMRTEQLGGQRHGVISQARGTGLRIRRDTLNKAKASGTGQYRRASVVHEDLHRHDSVFLHESSGEKRYHGGPPVPPPPPGMPLQGMNWSVYWRDQRVYWRDQRNRHWLVHVGDQKSKSCDYCWSKQSRSRAGGDSAHYSPSSYHDSKRIKRGPGGSSYGIWGRRIYPLGGSSPTGVRQRQYDHDDDRSYARPNRGYGQATRKCLRCIGDDNDKQWWWNYDRDRGTSSSSSWCDSCWCDRRRHDNGNRGWW